MPPRLTLPSNPNLRQLRNQAKDLWRACKSREPAAAWRIRRSLPQVADLSDEEVFRANLSLKDAQRALAREYGFHDWNALRRHVESASADSREVVFPEGALPEPVAAILRAVEDGDVEEVRALLDDDPALVHVRVRSDYEEGDTLLHRSDPQQADDGTNPDDPHLKVAQLLIDRGADINAVGGRGNTVGATPLDAAAWAGNVGMVKLLLANGADPAKGGHEGVDYNPVSTAVSHDRRAIFKLLIEAGARYGIQHTIRMGMLDETRALLDADPSLLNRTKKADPRWPDGEVPLVLAAGHQDIFALLLERGADVQARDPWGYTPLMAARAVGNVAAVQALLGRGAPDDIFGAIMDKDAARLATLLQGDPSAANPVGAGPVPLMWAARYGDRAIVQLLLEAGAEANVWRDEWKTPLDVAVRYQEDAVIQLLLDHGAAPDFEGDNGRAETLACALRNGTVRSLEMLLDAGADPNRADNFFGAWGGNLAKIKLLLDHGRDVGKDRPPGGRGQEDLSVAASNGQNASVELLLCHGADLDHVDRDGLTAIQQARKAHHASTVELLTEHAEIRKFPGNEAAQLLNHRRRLIDAYIDGTAVEVAAVLDVAPSLLESNVVQVSLLHDAAWKGEGDVVDVMVERGAAMTIHAAAVLGRVETVGTLLDADPSLIDALYEDQPMAELTPLKVAAHRARIGVVELLLDRGADINGRAILTNDGHGRSTVVHAAVSSGSVAMLKLLLDRGANVNLKNRWGASPLATNWRSRDDVHRNEIRDLLVAHGANPEDQPQELLMH